MGYAVVVMGVSGCGKSTVGAELARRLGSQFVDGDDLHPEANRKKMALGVPLTDEDRWPWLDRVAATLASGLAAEELAVHPARGAAKGREGGAGVVVACSALRRSYRDRLRGAGAGLSFIYLEVAQVTIESRLRDRQGHFFPAALVASQFATLEAPDPSSEPDVTVVPVLDLAAQVELALSALSRV